MESLLKLLLDNAVGLWEKRGQAVALAQTLARRRFALPTCVALLLTSVFLIRWYYERTERYEAVVAETLNIQSPSLEHPALENLLLSKIDQNVETDLKSERLDSDFEEAWKELVEAASHSATDDNPTSLIEASSGTRIFTEKEPGVGQQDNRKPGFLFAPYYLLQPQLLKSEEQRLFDGEQELQVTAAKPVDLPTASPVIANPILLREINVTKSLSVGMQKLASMPIVSQNGAAGKYLSAMPVQSYLVMSGGIIRVFTHDDPHPTKFFGAQFPSTTFFPGRPYFWPTFNSHPSFYTNVSSADNQATIKPPASTPNLVKSEATLGQFFRISPPYLDLGGSGIVVTLTRGLIIDGVAKAVICIDLRFDDKNSVSKSLYQTIGGLNANIYGLSCSVGQGSKQLNCVDDKQSALRNESLMFKIYDDIVEEWTDSENELYHEVHNEFARQSTDILSNIYRFDSGSKIRFSLPLDRTINADGSQKLTLMLASFDPVLYRKHSSVIALCAIATFTILTVFLAYLWGSLEVASTAFEAALKEVDGVMGACPTPYVRLNIKDEIKSSNKAFKDLINMPSISDGELATRTLRSFCDGESKNVYDNVEVQRATGTNVEPYSLAIERSDGTKAKVKVHSAAIPSLVREKLPDTFGIMVPD